MEHLWVISIRLGFEEAAWSLIRVRGRETSYVAVLKMRSETGSREEWTVSRGIWEIKPIERNQ